MSGNPDVLLVMLPYTGAYIPNLGLASVKAALEQGGRSGRILDLDYDFAGRLGEIYSVNILCIFIIVKLV